VTSSKRARLPALLEHPPAPPRELWNERERLRPQ